MIFTELSNSSKPSTKSSINQDDISVSLPAKEKDKTQKRILLAEDEEALCGALSLKLLNSGFQVTIVKNGQESIEKIQNEDFDLILLDLMMPVKDGFQVLESVKSLKNLPPIIILSNLSQDEDIEKAKSMGAKDFWIKSNLQLSQIIDLIKKFFDI